MVYYKSIIANAKYHYIAAERGVHHVFYRDMTYIWSKFILSSPIRLSNYKELEDGVELAKFLLLIDKKKFKV